MTRIALNPVNGLAYIVSAAFGLMIAAAMLRKTPSRVLWWEWLGLAAPVAVWTLMWSISVFTAGRKSLSNLGEPLYIGLVVGCLGIILRWMGSRWISPNVMRPLYIGVGCIVAVIVVLWVPMLRE